MTSLLQWLLGLLRAEQLAARTQASHVACWFAEEWVDDRLVRVVRLHNGSGQAIVDPLLSFFNNHRQRGREYVLSNFFTLDADTMAYAVPPGDTVRVVVEDYRLAMGETEIRFSDVNGVRWTRNVETMALRRDSPTAVERAVTAVKKRLSWSQP